MESLYLASLDKIKQSLYKDGRLDIKRPETPDLFCDEEPLTPDTAQALNRLLLHGTLDIEGTAAAELEDL